MVNQHIHNRLKIGNFAHLGPPLDTTLAGGVCFGVGGGGGAALNSCIDVIKAIEWGEHKYREDVKSRANAGKAVKCQTFAPLAASTPRTKLREKKNKEGIHTSPPSNVPTSIVLTSSLASSECPTSSKDSVASLPGRREGVNSVQSNCIVLHLRDEWQK